MTQTNNQTGAKTMTTLFDLKKLLPNRRLVHIKDEPQEKVIERMKRLLTQRAPDLKLARQTLTVNLIPPFQAGNANRWKAKIK
jgi:hypothetical protein